MRFAKSSRILLPLAVSAVLATSVLAQEHPNIQPNAVRNQLAGQTPGASQSQSAPQAQAPPPSRPKPASNPGAKAPAKAMAASKGPAKRAAAKKEPAKEAGGGAAKPPVEKPAEDKASVAKRDPFETLLNRARAGDAPPENLPPGKAGLIVATLRIDGIVRGPNGMIAIVTNPQQRVYFLHDGDKLYDGSVEKITLDAVSFHESGKDAFGKPLERVVNKRLYPSPGEEQ